MKTKNTTKKEESKKEEPKKIAVIAIFRDFAGPGLDRFFHRLNNSTYNNKLMRLFLVEGDSTDTTWNQLSSNKDWAKKKGLTTEVIKHDTGVAANTIYPEKRVRGYIDSVNRALDVIQNSGWRPDLLLFLAVDVSYDKDTIEKAIDKNKFVVIKDDRKEPSFILVKSADRFWKQGLRLGYKDTPLLGAKNTAVVQLDLENKREA